MKHPRKTLALLLAAALAAALLPAAASAQGEGVIAFEDPVVEARIRKILDMPKGPVTEADMLLVEAFSYDPSREAWQDNHSDPDYDHDPYARHDEIRTIADLAHCKNLKALDIADQPLISIDALGGLALLEEVRLFNCNNVLDVTPLADKAYLRSVTLSGTGVSDASAVLALPSLEEFHATWGTAIDDISALAGTSGLRDFSLMRSGVPVDLMPLTNHPRLRFLYTSDVEASVLSALVESCPELVSVHIDNAPLTSADIAPLAGLKALDSLYLSACLIDDVSVLSGMTGLKTLSLRDNRISDITPLAALKNLTYLDIQNNPIEDISPAGALSALTGWAVSPNEALYSLQSLREMHPKAGLSYGEMDFYPSLESGEEPILYGDAELLSETTMTTMPQASATLPLPDTDDPEELARRAEVVPFDDPVLEARMRKVLDIPEGDLTRGDLERVIAFSYDPINEGLMNGGEHSHVGINDPSTYTFDSVTDLSPLAYCANLIDLTLTYQGMESIEALRGLEKLQTVSLFGCYGVTDLSPLEGKDSITEVYISGMPVEDVSPVLRLKNLRTLWSTWESADQAWDLSPLRETSSLRSFIVALPIEDYTPLLSHPNMRNVELSGVDRETFLEMAALWKGLESLVVSDSPITGEDLAKVQGRALYSLHVMDCPLGSAEAVALMPRMEMLSLYGCGITDITPLEALRRLRSLDLYGNDIEDIAPLGTLSRLTYLNLSESDAYTDADIAAMLPDVTPEHCAHEDSGL